jgi:hypothetical protein
MRILKLPPDAQLVELDKLIDDAFADSVRRTQAAGYSSAEITARNIRRDGVTGEWKIADPLPMFFKGAGHFDIQLGVFGTLEGSRNEYPTHEVVRIERLAQAFYFYRLSGIRRPLISAGGKLDRVALTQVGPASRSPSSTTYVCL